ncbi:hypothetical protein ACSQ67_014509 [Phaseolus vulgaris]
MVSKPTDSASKPRKQLGEPANDALRTLSLKINQLKKQIQAERIVYIKVDPTLILDLRELLLNSIPSKLDHHLQIHFLPTTELGGIIEFMESCMNSPNISNYRAMKALRG